MQEQQAQQTQQTQQAQEIQDVNRAENVSGQEEYVSPFEEIKGMGVIQAFNILVQATNAAQRAGALSTKDSVFVAKAAEILQESLSEKSN